MPLTGATLLPQAPGVLYDCATPRQRQRRGRRQNQAPTSRIFRRDPTITQLIVATRVAATVPLVQSVIARDRLDATVFAQTAHAWKAPGDVSARISVGLDESTLRLDSGRDGFSAAEKAAT